MEISIKQLKSPALLKLIQERMKNMQELMGAIGELAKNAVDRNFRTEGESLGVSWAPLSKRYASQKAKKYGANKRILQARGNLRNSIKSIQPVVTANSVTIGTNLPYAAIHNFGGEIHQGARSERFGRRRGANGKFRKGKLTEQIGSGVYGKRNKRGKVTEQIRAFTFSARTIRIPQRQFMAIGQADEQRISRTVSDWLKSPKS